MPAETSELRVLVTGGANGIGRAIALGLARAGADVAVADLDAANMSTLAGEIEALGRRSITVEADIGDVAAIDVAVVRDGLLCTDHVDGDFAPQTAHLQARAGTVCWQREWTPGALAMRLFGQARGSFTRFHTLRQIVDENSPARPTAHNFRQIHP